MAFENLESAIQIWLRDMEHGPEDRYEAYLRLHELIAEIRATGMPVPEDLKAFERELEAEFESERAESDGERPAGENSGVEDWSGDGGDGGDRDEKGGS